MRSQAILCAACFLVGCGQSGGDSATESTGANGTNETAGEDTTAGPTDGATTGEGSDADTASAGATESTESTSGSASDTDDTGTTAGTTAGTTGEPPPDCDPGTTSGGEDAAEDYGHATIPPQMALADTFYTYELRTNIGDCSTDRVWWRFDEGPPGAKLELSGTDIVLEPGEEVQYEDGGSPRERVKVAWDLADVEPACYSMQVTWRAWLDCGLLDDGAWGPEVSQAWDVTVRQNHWYSGDMHVHTKHSERDDDSGSVYDYYTRMVNLTANDAGDDFAERRTRSLRGRLHWLIFSDHTNNELDECGRHFSNWCLDADEPTMATGRDVAKWWTEEVGDTLLVVGSEISNQFDGHFGFLPKNPYPGHPQYAPNYLDDATDYDYDAGFGPGIFRERWVDETATNQQEIDLIHAMGGLAIVNHESAPVFWIEYDWTSLDFDGLEVWNGGNRHDQFDDDAFHGDMDVNDITEDNLLAMELPEDPLAHSYIGMLKHGRWPMVLVGGSDVHDFQEVVCYEGPCDPTNAELALPTTTVWAESFVWTNGIDGVGDGLQNGRVVVHDLANFIDLRLTHNATEVIVGDTINAYEPGSTIMLRAFGRAANFVDGDNRVLLVLGTSGDPDDRTVDVLYNSEDEQHFVDKLKTKDHMRYIRPESSFDRSWQFELTDEQFGGADTYFVWAQFVPWHNPLYLVGNGQDMAATGAIRVRKTP